MKLINAAFVEFETHDNFRLTVRWLDIVTVQEAKANHGKPCPGWCYIHLSSGDRHCVSTGYNEVLMAWVEAG